MAIKLRMLRNAYVTGGIAYSGDVIAIEDAELAAQLIASAKAEPGDDATRDRVRTRAIVGWGRPADAQAEGPRVAARSIDGDWAPLTD